MSQSDIDMNLDRVLRETLAEQERNDQLWGKLLPSNDDAENED